jgi:hypothetical protein
MDELAAVQSIVKKSFRYPKQLKKESLLEIGKIRFGIVEERGEDLEATYPFKKCNLADFIDGKGYFNLIKFIGFNKQTFLFLYKHVCCLGCCEDEQGWM